VEHGISEEEGDAFESHPTDYDDDTDAPARAMDEDETDELDESDVAPVPVFVYGVNLLLAAIAYVILQQAIIRLEGPDSRLKTAIGSDWKGKVSPLIYLLGIAVTFISPWLSVALYAVVALIWLVPDKRLEAFVAQIEEREAS